MFDSVKPLYAKVADGVYCGNVTSAKDISFISDHDITAVINLTGRIDPFHDHVDYFEYVLPSQELMDTEFPKTLSKLETIVSDLADLRNNGRNVLIHCVDGRNKCMLVAGYYLITRIGRHSDDVIAMLEQLYFTPQQVREEQDARTVKTVMPEDMTEGVATRVDQDAARRREERNAVRCLTLSSFKKILRSKGK